MFLFFSKTLDLLLAPLTWVILLLCASILLLLWRRARLAGLVVALALAVLALFSSDAVADRLARYAEAGAPRTFRPDVTYDAVIVLGGMVDPGASRASGEAELTDAVERVLRAFELLRSGQARNVLLTGGFIGARPGDRSEAEWLAAKLEEWGIARERVAIEGKSLNTRENAVESSRIVAQRGWRTLLLVTSAMHMPRALGCFRQAGLHPDALPVDFRGSDGRGTGWQPRAASLARSTDAVRELAGRVVYRVVGYSQKV